MSFGSEQIAVTKQVLGKKPGYVKFKILNNLPQLDDLWFMVGSRCNLTCKHCYVASSPTNDTLQQIGIEDIKPFLEESKKFGIKNIYFTGGEPFINKDINVMIEESLKYSNVTVLTNATYPITRFIPELKKLNFQSENKLIFRVSLDHFKREVHDKIRGNGSFDLTIKNAISLFNCGFKPIITSTAIVYENNDLTQEEIELEFKKLFLQFNVEIHIKLLPYNLEMGSNLSRIKNHTKYTYIYESCMEKPGINNDMFQCHNGRTVEKINGKMIVYPCPIIYNEQEFELASNLKDSFKKVYLTHKACFDFCYKSKGKCTN